MENQPPSIWKKIWRGPRATALWLALVACAAFIVAYVVGAACRMGQGAQLFVMSLIIASALAVVGLLAMLFLRWVGCWRNFRRFLLGLACVITFIALVYLEENVRGKSAWNNFQREWGAKGEKFDWASFVPPKVPDEQNFGALPIWTNMLRFEWDPEQQREVWRGQPFMDSFKLSWSRADTNHPGNVPPIGDWQQQRRTDLAPWQAYYRATNIAAASADAPPIPVAREFPVALEPQSPAADVLLALTRNESEMKSLREAVTRPRVRYPLRYEQEDVFGILLPHLAKGKEVARVCQLQAIAALQSGQTDLAFDDIRLGLKLTDSSGGDFFLISHLVRIAISQITLVPVWEGLADHKWSETQLAELERLLGQTDFLADHLQGIRTERAAAGSVCDYLLRHRSFFGRNVFDELGVMDDGGENTASFEEKFFRNAAFHAAPRGWFYQNNLTVARLHQELILPIVDEKTRVIKPGVVRANDAKLSRRLNESSPFNILARSMLPSLGRLAEKSAYGQTGVNLARVACALERHWLANGTYPESLDVLAPKYLSAVPHDVINGQPLHYRRTDDGCFLLYSVGWNEKDDGGTIVVGSYQNKAGMRTLRREQGDWVWSYMPVPVTTSDSPR